jgi:DNA-binding MurR/RpiR family transcriptional regulator
MLKTKSKIAQELQIHSSTLKRLCQRFGLWEANDMRKIIEAEEAQHIMTFLGEYCANRKRTTAKPAQN